MADQLYIGPWINWSHGLVGGMTVTINDRSGGLLTAFIATFVTIAGAELWKILCYVFHQVRSTPIQQDGLYHQQQMIFRTSTTPGGAAWLFLQQAWFWTGRARLAVVRTLPWACFSITYIVAVGLMAIFSSQISKTPGPQRLLSPDNCGTWALNTSSPDSLSAWQSKMTNDSLSAASYARACYSTTPDPLRCERYPVPSINYTSNANATCPFESGTCVYGDTAAFSMTSRVIDSHIDLGINAPPYNRINLQKTTTCAPLHAGKFATSENVTNSTVDPGSGEVGDVIYKFWFGPMLGSDGTNITDFTFNYNTHSWKDGFGYSLSAYMAAADYPKGEGIVDPIPQIKTTSSDLSLLFITPNTVRFSEKCYDPVFSATRYQVNGTYNSFWYSDYFVSVVACSEEYQICNPSNNKCTPKLGNYQLQQAMISNEDGLGLNAKQNATAYRLAIATTHSSIYYATFSRGAGALRAGETVSQLSQAPLPSTQWHVEVGSWFDAGLARIQALTQEYVTNPANLVPGSYLDRFEAVPGNAWWEACFAQYVKGSPGTTSFSVEGLVVLFVLGGIIIFTSLSIDTVVGYIQTKTGFGEHKRMEWLVNDRLHMQRLLLKELKLGQWHDGLDKKIPVTINGEQRFSGPAEKEVNLQHMARDGGDGRFDGSNVQLVQEEHIYANGEKGWSNGEGGIPMARLR